MYNIREFSTFPYILALHTRDAEAEIIKRYNRRENRTALIYARVNPRELIADRVSQVA